MNNKEAGEVRICAVIPTYNNAGTILDVVKGVLRQLPDVVVVIDGSTARTNSSPGRGSPCAWSATNGTAVKGWRCNAGSGPPAWPGSPTP